jgi:DNA-binding CsgD family transcriptional regulator
MITDSRVRGRSTTLTGRRSEREVLDRLIDAVRAGESRVLVVDGEPGVGKTALLDYVARQAPDCRVARATGVQSEMELAFAGLHQLCVPVLDRVDRLPAPQRDSLRVAFGLSAGPVPNRFFIGLAALSLLTEAAGEQPLVCLVDDVQWLDRASVQVLGFVARRLKADRVAMIFAARVLNDELAGLPELVTEGLREDDARQLLDSVLIGPLDPSVRDRIVTETRGNPLALLELVRELTSAGTAGGFGLPGSEQLPESIEDSFRRRIDALPVQSRLLLLLAAADPTGDPSLVWRAAGRLGIAAEAATPGADAGLVEFGAWVRFRHPLVRSAAYLSASPQKRQDVHRALAMVTDPDADPDRRAWHRAHAAAGPDEEVAGELERSADRARARGGLAAAAAFWERAAMLTPDPGRQAHRLLTAARAKRDAGALDAALGLLVSVETGPRDPLQAAEVEHLRGQIALDQRRGSDAVRLLLGAAQRLEPIDPGLARETHLEALVAAIWVGDLDNPGRLRETAIAAREGSVRPEPPRTVDFLLDAVASRLAKGYAAAAPSLSRALDLTLAVDSGTDGGAEHWLWLTGGRAVANAVALDLWDFEAWHTLGARQVQAARDTGALAQLQFALYSLATSQLVAGELATAARLIDEVQLIDDVIGSQPLAYTGMSLAAWRGEEARAQELIEATKQNIATRGLGMVINIADCASAVLYNGLGRYGAARDAARRAFERDQLGIGPFAVPELAESAFRTGEAALLADVLKWLSERTRANPTDWVLGTEATVQAMLTEGDDADCLYRESISRLARTPVRSQLARAHLLYGEWLRRERRRADAREQLHIAHDMLATMGIQAFAGQARRELAAAGGGDRKRATETTAELTVQERRVAQLARDGLSNAEIGAQVFISARTVQYHLAKTFTKLGISSRSQLGHVLPANPDTAEL